MHHGCGKVGASAVALAGTMVGALVGSLVGGGAAAADPWDSIPTMLTSPGGVAASTPAWAEVGAMASLGDRCVFWAGNGRVDLPEE